MEYYDDMLINSVQASWDDRWQPVSGLNWEYRGTHTLTAYGGMEHHHCMHSHHMCMM